MTSEELRELAELIGDDELSKRGRYIVADYLRACADALDAGPVAMGWRSQTGEVADCISIEEAGRNGAGAYTLSLYQVAMPGALRLPEPMTEGEISDRAREMVKGGKSVDWLARAIETVVLRRVKEANE